MVGVAAVGALRHRLDRSWRRPRNGNIVIAGSPLRMFRLTDSGINVIRQLEGQVGSGPTTDTPASRLLLDRLVDAGALHPLPSTGPFGVADVTIVVPTHERLPAWLADAAACGAAQTVLVDDGSRVALDTPAKVTVLRHESNRGPAAARNSGLAKVATALVAFLDSDVSLPAATNLGDFLTALLVHFTDSRVALVAPRVAGAPGATWLAGYEQRHSPLDLGEQPARVAPGTRVTYVPAAALLCRTEALREIGGFDESLRVGEDVDLVWRLVAAGHRCRYEPTVVALHEPRASLAALLGQRFGYGRSAASLASRHPGAVTPLRISRTSALALGLIMLRRPLMAAAVIVGATVALGHKLRGLPPSESARLVGLGTLGAGRQLAAATTREWWPPAVALAVLSPRSRVPLLAAVLVPTIERALADRSLQPITDAPVQLCDRVAYGAGVWAGAVDQRNLNSLLPDMR
ncbi:MAG: mycofactocin biosynthesis glycosyltransferase MftF [Actinobacteria bacterium]|nr:mycofactocin biosynthesis glycosyltransferase MftF [Actinomycetota bacterium]